VRAALLVTLAVVTAAPAARAQGIDLVGVGARAIGRAGAAVVSADDHAALWYNPAGLARRGDVRGQAGLSLADQALHYKSGHAFQDTPAEVDDRAGVEVVGWAGAQAALGDRVVVGLGYLAPSALSFATPEPANYEEPQNEDDHRYPHRHAATRFRLMRRGLAAGVAVRALPWLAVGVSGHAFDVQVSERRTIVGGYARVDPDFRDPDGDMELAVGGRDRFVPAASFGLIVAPEDAPIELGASILWCDSADLSGPIALLDTRGRRTTTGHQPYATAYVSPDGEATMTVPFPLVARAGVRFLTSYVAVELAGELGQIERRDLTWSLRGADVTCLNDVDRTDPCPTTVPIESLPVGTRWRTGYTLRAAVDTTILEGFLTLSAGYAFARGIVPKSALSTAFPDLDSHTVALGLEAHVEGAAVTLGLARTERIGARISAETSQTLLVAPFRDSTLPVGAGRYDGAATLVGLGIELELR
jgi:long-subunit fatty acid transport protein